MIAKERSRARRNECKQQGICIYCMSKPARIGFVKCQSCTDIVNTNARNRVANDIVNGICLDCDSKAVEGQRYCETHRKLNSKRNKIRYDERRELGLCILCVTPAVGNSDVCETHYLKRAALKHLGSSKKWEILSEQLNKQNKKCLYCGIILVLGANTQTDHYNSLSKHPEQARDPNNIVWACEPCNQAKGDMTGPEFIALCKRVVAIWPS